MNKKTMKFLALLVAVILCTLCVVVLANAADHSFTTIASNVELDGENDGTATVSISASDDTSIVMIQGTWSVTEEEPSEYFELVDITSNVLVFDGVNYDADPESGELVWMDDTYNGISLAKDSVVLTATYKVAADTPEGTYTVNFVTDVIADGDWNEIYDSFTATITVTRTPAHTCEFGEPTYEWSQVGTAWNCEAKRTCECEKFETAVATINSETVNMPTCTTMGETEYTAEFDVEWAETQYKTVADIDVDPDNHTWSDELTYMCNEDTHTEIYTCENDPSHIMSGEPESHSYDEVTHKCECGDVQMFTLKFTTNNGNTSVYASKQVPYGAKIVDYLPEKEDIANKYVNDYVEYGVYKFNGSWVYDSDAGPDAGRDHIYDDTTMPASDFVLIADYYFTGWWLRGDNNWHYNIDSVPLKSGWTLISEADFTENGTDKAWYYLDPCTCEPDADYCDCEATGYRAKGVTRVPYPTEAINGVTYEADKEAIEYSAGKGETFIDKNDALFYFDENGKFQNTFTGLTTYKDATRYVENGMLTWHPGFVTVDDTLYYFIGDLENGGNIPANGETYITKPNGVDGYKAGDIVTFVNGQVKTELDGIENVDGTLYYYENGKLAYGKGLVAITEGDVTKYIYVRSNGKLATGDYWITKTNDLPVKAKMYNFGTDGYLQNPVDPSLNGVVDGYYYVNGSVEYGAGLIEWNGNIYYVRSNGQVATGTYYVTNVSNYEGDEYKTGDKLVFAEDGKLLPAMNGVIDGYYYIDNSVACGAGLIEWNGDIYYVRSNGQVATGTYYVTNVANYNGTAYKSGDKLVFAEDGKLITK